LVTSDEYDAAGRLSAMTDPRGLITRTYDDALGRVTKTIANDTNGTPTDASNHTVEYTYDGIGDLLTLKADLPGGGGQTTQYVYGVSPAGGSNLASNDLVAAVRHPDKTTGAASGAEADTSTYNALGELKTATDRNGTVHTYTHDVLGRLTSDAVTALG